MSFTWKACLVSRNKSWITAVMVFSCCRTQHHAVRLESEEAGELFLTPACILVGRRLQDDPALIDWHQMRAAKRSRSPFTRSFNLVWSASPRSSWVAGNKSGMLLSCGDVAVTAGWFKKEELRDHRNVAVKIKEQNELLDCDTAELWFVCLNLDFYVYQEKLTLLP